MTRQENGFKHNSGVPSAHWYLFPLILFSESKGASTVEREKESLLWKVKRIGGGDIGSQVPIPLFWEQIVNGMHSPTISLRKSPRKWEKAGWPTLQSSRIRWKSPPSWEGETPSSLGSVIVEKVSIFSSGATHLSFWWWSLSFQPNFSFNMSEKWKLYDEERTDEEHLLSLCFKHL